MPGDGGLGEAGKLGVRNDGRLLETLGEPAQERDDALLHVSAPATKMTRSLSNGSRFRVGFN
jgi:hypothetical protein